MEPAGASASGPPKPTVEDSFLDLFARTEARSSESRDSQRHRADHWEPNRGHLVGGDHTRGAPAAGAQPPSTRGTPAASAAGTPATTRNPFDDLIGSLATTTPPLHAAPPPPQSASHRPPVAAAAPSNPFGDVDRPVLVATAAAAPEAQSSNPFD